MNVRSKCSQSIRVVGELLDKSSTVHQSNDRQNTKTKHKKTSLKF